MLEARLLRRLEDLYLPFKPKKQSLAAKAREQGLEPLANEIEQATVSAEDLDRRAADFINEDKKVPDAALTLVGAGHILAERFSEQADLRQLIRKIYRKSSKLTAAQVSETHKKNSLFKDYFTFSELTSKIPPHRVLAINRGERAKVLRVGVECDREEIVAAAEQAALTPDHPHFTFLRGCLHDAIDRLILPSLERELRRELTDKAEGHAVEVFARNLRNLLLQPPVPGRRVLAIDPGYKNGCKLAMLDEHGGKMALGLIHIVGSEEQQAQAREQLIAMIREHSPQVIAIGNGSACRPTEHLVSDLLATELADSDVRYVIVNEAGASVYSTSPIGREEFPDCEAIDRSAISIGRRLQVPLSELVKIDPASIGVGLYQHDAKPAHLRDTVDETVRLCVSFVGVDVNTASAPLLRNVAGLNQLVARRILEYRTEHGPFRSRQGLREVKGLGEQTFIQAAGFLKIEGGENPLDATWVHPESYPAAERLLARLGIPLADVGKEGWSERFAQALSQQADRTTLASELELGEHSLNQLIEALERPGRDLRADLPPPVFRRDVVKLDDLEVGMQLRGTVLNVVDFGAFVDVGLSDSGLVHVSQIHRDYVRDPHTVVAVGDQVNCWVTAVDKQARRVSLTMIEPGTERTRPPRGEKRGEKRRRPRRPAKPQQDAAASSSPQASTSTDGASRPARPPRGTRGKPSRESRPRQAGRGETRPFERKAKKPLVPITKAMEEGKEAMRTFGDLLQFHQKKQEKQRGGGEGESGQDRTPETPSS